MERIAKAIAERGRFLSPRPDMRIDPKYTGCADLQLRRHRISGVIPCYTDRVGHSVVENAKSGFRVPGSCIDTDRTPGKSGGAAVKLPGGHLPFDWSTRQPSLFGG
jgi:hypothetical protein